MMNLVAFVAFMLAPIVAQQGQAVRLSIPDQPGIKTVELQWHDKTIPYGRAGREWITVLGVDLDVKPGSYDGELRVRKGSGVERTKLPITVKAVKYPLQHLTVADEYVELSPENTERALREAK